MTLDEAIREHFVNTLERNAFKLPITCQQLGISIKTGYNYLRKYDLVDWYNSNGGLLCPSSFITVYYNGKYHATVVNVPENTNLCLLLAKYAEKFDLKRAFLTAHIDKKILNYDLLEVPYDSYYSGSVVNQSLRTSDPIS